MKIETWTFRFLGDPFSVPVHFHPAKGQFVAAIPEEIAFKLTGRTYDEKQTGNEFNELRTRIREMITKRERELLDKEIRKKVIAYSVALGGCFDYTVNGRKRTFEGESSALGISMTWRILHHSKLRDIEEYRDEQGEVTWIDHGHRSTELTMEWTEQRENFFAGVETALQAMVLKMDRFFNKQGKKKLLAVIDSGGALALPEPDTTEEVDNGEGKED